MLARKVIVPAAITAAIGLPLITSTQSGHVDYTRSHAADEAVSIERNPLESLGDARPMLQRPIANLDEILRFDIYPNWVKSRWSRVSTAPLQDGLQGMRVALVTGVNAWDLCGSLTYYFDDRHRVQRISLVGITGDAEPMVQYLAQQFGFKAHRSMAAGFYTASRRNHVTGLLRVDHFDIIDAAHPNEQLSFVLEINKPDGPFVLSQSTAAAATARPY